MPSKPHSMERNQDWIDQKRLNRMNIIDSLPADLRGCVHDYGLNVVNAFMSQGVTKPKSIRHIVETVLDEFSPTRGSFSTQGPSTELTRNQKGRK